MNPSPTSLRDRMLAYMEENELHRVHILFCKSDYAFGEQDKWDHFLGHIPWDELTQLLESLNEYLPAKNVRLMNSQGKIVVRKMPCYIKYRSLHLTLRNWHNKRVSTRSAYKAVEDGTRITPTKRRNYINRL